MAKDTYSSGEFDLSGGAAEPAPGTPAFGQRAAKRRTAIAAPAPGDEPTPEELAGAQDVAGSEERFLAPEPESGTAAAAAQPALSEEFLSSFDIPVPTIEALVGDPTPPDPSDPEGDILDRLTSALLQDPTPTPQPRSFTQGEHIALGIMGALDGEVFQNVVLPMLEAERQAPRQAALDAQAQQARRITALQALAGLMETRKQNRAGRVQAGNQQLLDALKMRQAALAGNAQRRAMIFAAVQRAKAKDAAKEKIGDRVLGTYTLATIALQNAVKMKKIIDNNPNIGGFIAGSETLSRLGLRSHEASDLASLGGTVAEAILMINQRRGTSKETMRKIGDSLPDIRMSPAQLKAAVANVIREYGMFMSGTEARFPTIKGMKNQMVFLLDKAKDDPDALAAIVNDPESWNNVNGFAPQTEGGSENGDVDLNLWLDDDEVNR